MLSIHNRTKRRLSKVDLYNIKGIKNYILKDKYELSLVICGDKLSKRLNQTYRNKDKPANVLSFPLSKTEGEIFLNSTQAMREAKHFERKPKKHLLALFAHGCAHLAGYKHSKRMELVESKALAPT